MTKTFTFQIVGNYGVGKTTFINRLATGDFKNTDYDEQLINWQNDTKIKTTTMTNDNFDGAVLMFDIHNPNSFEYIEKYFTSEKPIVLIGNKCDLEMNNSYEEKWYVQKWRELQKNKTNMKFYEISAKSNYNIDKPFDALIEQCETLQK